MTAGAGRDESAPGGSGPATDGPGLLHQQFTEADLTSLRRAVAAAAATVGLSGDLARDFVLAVHELVTNAVLHGGGGGTLRLRLLSDVLVCEIVDHGGPVDGLPVRLSPADQPGGRGLWLAHQLTGSLMLTQRPDGVTASVSACVTGSPAVALPEQPTGGAVTSPVVSQDR